MIGLNYIGFSSYLYLQVEKGLLTTFKTQLLKKLTLLTLVLSFNKSTNQPKYLLEIPKLAIYITKYRSLQKEQEINSAHD